MSRSSAAPPYVFISYASADHERVLFIIDALRDVGIACWMDQHDIAGGANWGGSIADAIEGCTAFVLMSSAASLSSRNVRQEIALAWQHDKPYLPLLLDATPIPNDVAYWLVTAQWIEILDHPPDVWLPKIRTSFESLAFNSKAPISATVNNEAPSPRQSLVSPVSIPTPLTDIIGRSSEIAEIVDLLDVARLVTLTGPGGTGKTRLSIAVAHHRVTAFRDGVVFVPLAAIRDPSLVISTIATALDVREIGDEPLLVTLIRALANRNLLLVLDNLEQIIESASELSKLLQWCPQLQVLATSRTPLRVSGEREYAVLPLSTPDSDTTIQMLAEIPSVSLFVERAHAVRRDFQLSPGNATDIATICRQLDGLPLAIELAAARVKHLQPDAILKRLDRPLSVLTGGGRDLPTRQQTLRNTIAWSYELLEPGEQRLFRALSIFRGGWTLETAEAIVGDDLEIDVFEGLEQLVEHSLIQIRDQPDGTVRYSMLETIHEFGLELLQEHHEIEQLRRRHLTFVLRLAEQAEPHFSSVAGSDWLARFECENDNVRGALQWAIEHDPLAGLDLAANVWRFWFARGYLTEGRNWLVAALATSGDADLSVRSRAFQRAGGLSIVLGDFTRAWSLLSEARVLATEAGDKSLICYALNGLGWTKYERHEFDASRELFEECLSLAREMNDGWRIGMTLTHLGKVSAAQGNVAVARSQLDDGLALIRESGDVGNVAWALDCRAKLALRQKDLETARSALEEVLAIRRERQEAEVVTTMEMLAALVAERNEPERAVRVLAFSSRLRETTGYAIQIMTADERERLSGELRTILGEDIYAKHWSEGWTLSLADAVAVALDAVPSPDDSAPDSSVAPPP